MKIRYKIILVLVLMLTQNSCHIYTVYNYKYSDYLNYGIEASDELMGKLIFYCPFDMIYERVTKTDLKNEKIEINERKRQEVDRYLTYKDRIMVAKGTKGVYFSDDDFLKESYEDYVINEARIWVDFGDSIIIPFSTYYLKFTSIPGDILDNNKEDSKGLTKIDRRNLGIWKNMEFNSENKFTIPYNCNSDDCIEYEVKGYKNGVLSCKNWKKYDLKKKSIDVEIVNEKKARGKTKHNY